jgi:hypothetical protein
VRGQYEPDNHRRGFFEEEVMATLSSDASGNRRIQFNDPRNPGKRASIWLGRVPKKMAASFCSNVEAILASTRLGTPPGAELCSWLRDLPNATYQKLIDVGLAEPRATARIVTLDDLLTTFVDRASVKATTRAAYKQTTDSLRSYLGGQTLSRRSLPSMPTSGRNGSPTTASARRPSQNASTSPAPSSARR